MSFRGKCAFAALIVLALVPDAASARSGPAPSPRACGRLVPFLVVSPNKVIYAQAGELPLLLRAGITITAAGASNAYHPDDWPGLDALANAGSPGNWWGLATDRFGRPFIQRAADPAPGFYVSITSLTDTDNPDIASPRRYTDSTRIPYVVLPGGSRARKAYDGVGVRPGDIAIVYNTHTKMTAYGVYGDTGSSSAFGQGSIKLAQDLGYYDVSPRHGGTGERENLYLIFPGSGAGFPRDLEHTQKTARALLAKWGGDFRLKDCAQNLR